MLNGKAKPFATWLGIAVIVIGSIYSISTAHYQIGANTAKIGQIEQNQKADHDTLTTIKNDVKHILRILKQ